MNPANLRAGLILLTGIFMLFAAWSAYERAIQYETTSAEIAGLMDTDERIDELTEKTLEILSLGFYESANSNAKQLQELTAQRDTLAAGSLFWTLAFIMSVVLTLGIAASAPEKRRAIGVVAAWTSVPALLVGVMAPILVIVAYKELPVLGETVLKFDSKGIASSVGTLFRTDNAVVAVIILAFSIVFPTLKAFTLITATIPNWRIWSGLPMHWLHVLGRWSMADIFVVALLLTYFVAEKSDVTRAEVQTGFHFFLTYVALSQLAAWLLDAESS